MFELCCDIDVGELNFDYVHEAEVKSAWKNMTNTAVLKFPRNLKTKNNARIDETVKVGDKVSILLGYDADPISRFKGYVSEIGAGTQVIEIKCEDEMWKLKQTSFTKSWKAVDVKDILAYIKQKAEAAWEYEVLGDSFKIGVFTVENMSAAKVLLKLKDEWGVYSFFRDGKLIAGKPYEPEPSKRKKAQLEYGRNVISWKDLTYKRAIDVKLKITAVNQMPDGKKNETVVGDADGDSRSLHFYNEDAAVVKKRAEELLALMKYDGYRGKVTLFGEPFLSDGYVVEIKDARYIDRAGEYFVDEVETTFKVAQMRQVVTLGPAASSIKT